MWPAAFCWPSRGSVAEDGWHGVAGALAAFLPMRTERNARQLKYAGQGARRALGYGSCALSEVRAGRNIISHLLTE